MQWEEWTGRAFHLRRRLTAEEQANVGPAVDCRGTPEWGRRFAAVEHLLPPMVRGMAHEEAI